jgi:hypothetical protein
MGSKVLEADVWGAIIYPNTTVQYYMNCIIVQSTTVKVHGEGHAEADDFRGGQ